MKRTKTSASFSHHQFSRCQSIGISDGSCRHYSFFQQQGETLANLGQYQQALQSFDRAIALNPNISALWVFRAVVLIHLQNYHDALDCCDRAIGLTPNDTEAWIFRGVALHYLGDYRASYRSYAHATPPNPHLAFIDWHDWLHYLGQQIRVLKQLVWS